MKKSRADKLVKVIEHQNDGENLEQLFDQEMELLAIGRLRVCIGIFMVFFTLIALLDVASGGVIQSNAVWSSDFLLELFFVIFLGLTFIPTFRRNVYAFAFLLSLIIGLHTLLNLIFTGEVAKDSYIIFALVFSILGILMPWGGKAIAGICLPVYLCYPVGIFLAPVQLNEHFFLKSNIYLALFMVLVITAAAINESIRFQEFVMKKRLETENTILQGYQTRLKRAYERMENLAIIDPLTRVYNRSYLTQWLTTEVYKNKLASRIFSTIMYDIDRFKEINDSSGHQMGDRMLQRVTEIVQEELDRNALMFRYGGDEFCVILPGIDLANAVKTAERIRRRIETHPDTAVKVSDVETIRASVSMGVTTEFVSGLIDVNFLIRWLDAALLESKRQGRNCIHVFDPVERRIRNAFQWLERSEL